MEQLTVWVLNFDAELELADPAGYERSGRMQTHCEDLRDQLLPSLRHALGEEPILIEPGRRPQALPEGALGFCWCPTPSALRLLAELGIEPAQAPELGILQQANHRAFCDRIREGLGPELRELPGAGFVRSLEELQERWRAHPEVARWLLKRPLGFAGRWRKLVEPASLDQASRTWIESSMRQYGQGLQVEPMVEVDEEYSLHGTVGPAGFFQLLDPVRQQVLPEGAWECQASMEPDFLGEDETVALGEVLVAVTQELAGLGYVGPFNVEGFWWKGAGGERSFRPLSELNARFSMGFFESAGGRLRELLFSQDMVR